MENVIVSIQRAEMVMKIVEEIQRQIYELGNDGRLVKMQVDELIGGLEKEETLIIKDYIVPGKGRNKRTPENAQQHVGAQPGVDHADRHAVQPRALRDADIQQLNAALGKGAHADGGGEADQAGNHAGGGQLGIDDHREPQLVANEADLGYIFRVAHARDGLAAGRPARDQEG